MKKVVILIFAFSLSSGILFSQNSISFWDGTCDGSAVTTHDAGVTGGIVSVEAGACDISCLSSDEGVVKGRVGTSGSWEFPITFSAAGGEIAFVDFNIQRSRRGHTNFEVFVDGVSYFSYTKVDKDESPVSTQIFPAKTYSQGQTAIVKVVATGSTSNTCTSTARVIDMDVRGASLLPVKLTSFTVEKWTNNARLKWSTKSEINNDYFEIEQSNDGLNFLSVGTVSGMGSINVSQEYQFVLPIVKTSVNYFRLNQVDFDGNYEYSPIVVLSSNHELPTPQAYVDFNEKLRVTGMQNSFYSIRALNGKKMLEGTSEEYIDVSSLRSGLYLLSFDSGSGIKTLKFFK